MRTTFLQPLRTVALLALLWVLPQSHTSAQEFEVDGIWYSVLSESEVKSIPTPGYENLWETPCYGGDTIQIPETVTYEDIVYTVTTIGRGTFNGEYMMIFSGTSTIILPHTITKIESEAFYARHAPFLKFIQCMATTPPECAEGALDMGAVPTIYVPEGAKEAYQKAYGWKNFYIMEGEMIPDFTVDEIGFHVQTDTTVVVSWAEMKELYIPETVSDGIREYKVTAVMPHMNCGVAFVYYSPYEKIVIPSTIQSLGDCCFKDAYELHTIVMKSRTPLPFNRAFDPNKSIALYVPKGSLQAYQEADGWKEFTIVEGEPIPDFTVDNLTYHITPGADKASLIACSDVSVLTGDIIIPDTVSNGLYKFVVSEIMDGVFRNAKNVTGLVLPSTIESIGSYAFGSCTGLQYIQVMATVPPSCSVEAFNGVDAVLYVPKGTSGAYQEAEGWSSFSNIIDGEPIPDFTVNGLTYHQLSNTTVSLIDGTSANGDVSIPETVQYNDVYYTVTEIGDTAFYQCANLVSVTIPKSITCVAKKAFYECSGLKFVEIADGSTPLAFTDNYQFWTSPLDSAYIGRDLDFQSGSSRVVLTAGGYSPFVGRNSQSTPIKSVVFGDSVTIVENYLFQYSASLERIVFGDNVKEILKSAFSDCSALTALELPASVTTIDRGFTNCTNISRVECLAETPPTLSYFPSVYATLYVPEGCLEAYQNDAVWGNERYFARIIDAPYVPDFMVDGIKYSVVGKGKVAVVVINETTKYEGDLVLPETVVYKGVTYTLTTIGNGAFNGCNNLKLVSIPATVTSIEQYAFTNCSPRIECKAMTPPACVSGSFSNTSDKVYIPEGTLELYRAATGWEDFTYLIDAAYVPDFTVDGVTYTQLGKESVGVTGLQPVFIDEYSIINEVVLPETVDYEGISYRLTEIHNAASSWLKSIVIPEGVTTIRGGAFDHCSYLTSVTFPTSLITIGEYAFSSCSSLTSIELPEGLTSLGSGAFYWCENLRKITIPASVTAIEEGAFGDCPADTIIVKSRIPPTVGQWADGELGGRNHNLLIVPTGSWNAYMSTTPWKYFLEIREEGGRSNVFVVDGIRYKLQSVSSNEVNVVAGGDYRGDIVIPGSVMYEGKEYVVTDIAKEAFRGCADLTSVVISEGVRFLHDYAFQQCTNLKSVTIPSTLEETVFCHPFYFCKGLENIVVADNHPTLESRGNAIIRKESLELIFGCKSTVIPDDVTGIAPYAFYYTDIREVKIPNSVTRIGDRAFTACDSLVSLYVGSGAVEFAYRTNGYGAEGLGNQVRNALSSFSYCNNLRTIVVAEGNPLIDSRNGCNAIVETATNTILLGCNETTIPEGVSAIEFGAFTLCEKLEALHIPSSLDTIPLGTFSYCPNLTTITVADGNSNFDSRSNCNAIIETATNTLLRGCVNTVIPEDVEHITAEAFYNCKGLEKIVIPDAVQTVGYRAFNGCTSLTSITFGASVRELGIGVFPQVYPSLDSPYLETIAFRGATPPAFFSPYELSQYRFCTQLLVPEGALAAYQSADVWKDFFFITEGEEMVEFESDGILYRVVLGDDYAMVRPRPGKDSASEGDEFVSAGMISVYPDSVVIPETVWYDNKEYVVNAIGEYAFYGCELRYLSIPATVEKVGLDGLCTFYGDVLCYATIPPKHLGNSWFGVSNDVVLRVPKASMDLYEQAEWWRNFWYYNAKIEAIEDVTGIERAEADVPYIMQTDAVYDLSGRRITDVENLKNGIYIVNGVKVVIK